MASSRAAAGPFALCILLLASPAVSATFLFDGGKSAAKSKGKGKEAVDVEWRPATATWYGEAEGDGSTGGACGYGTLVDVVPMKARVGSVSPVLFKGGEGCGACYKRVCACIRTACKYGGKNIAFHVNEGSTSFWLSLLVEFEDGEGDIGSMQLKQVNGVNRAIF
ncbi:unnamed protein product [Triticum turgidum subsp. durum]|uniref:Expansin-like EG45 domain-containing protein n=1 Tax=Triticum turgidum subsp. durum TaxID=4567 RepID=A0A9R1RAJ0_TRITD|nr:unnamed protein product [Triticum turgidum subsp. durum]